jgi:hypothetical protein
MQPVRKVQTATHFRRVGQILGLMLYKIHEAYQQN